MLSSKGTLQIFFFFVAWGGHIAMTLAGRKMLYAYIRHSLARPTVPYVMWDSSPKGPTPTLSRGPSPDGSRPPTGIRARIHRV